MENGRFCTRFAIMKMRSGNCITKSKRQHLQNIPDARSGVARKRKAPLERAVSNQPVQMSDRPCACEGANGIPGLCPHMQIPGFARSQTADKPCKRKNANRKEKSGWHFCLLCQHRLQISVTYVRVSSLICSLASLYCRLFQRLSKRWLCQRFASPGVTGGA